MHGARVKMLNVILVTSCLLDFASANELEERKAEYQKWDKELNSVFGELKKELHQELFEVVRKDQRDWVHHKEFMASWESKARGKETAEDPGYWERATDMTESRVTFLHHLDGDPRIRVVGANTQPFHGARAYFDGAYLRVGLLDEKEQAEVLEIAKRGGSPE